MPRLHATIALLRCEMKSFAIANGGVLNAYDALGVAALCSPRDLNQVGLAFCPTWVGPGPDGSARQTLNPLLAFATALIALSRGGFARACDTLKDTTLMGPISALFTADFATTATPAEHKPSALRSAFAALATMVASARKAANERHLRAELADMDDSLLRDIGVAEDEIYLIRAGQVFTPRAWANKPAARNTSM
jgi:uncharacterized protein YjiS (DUF1127 family)